MAAFAFSTIIGLIRTVVVAGAFGTGKDMEAFSAANRVSETIFVLVAGGALGSAFIPVFTGLLAKGERKRAWRTASAVVNLALLILIGVAVVAYIFAPQIVRYLLAPGFAEDPAQEALTVSLIRLMLPSAAIFGVSGLVMAILNSHQVFFVPALAPSMYPLGIIFGVLFLSPHLGIYGLAWGVLIGASLHLLIQVPLLLRQGGEYLPTLGLDMQPVRTVGRLMTPRLLGVAVVEINFWVNTILASQQPIGSLPAILYAFTLMRMPLLVIAQSIAVAALPTFSTQAELGRLGEMRASLAATLRGVLLLSLPASVGLVLLRYPIVGVVLERGEFGPRSTDLVAWALLWYGAGLVGHSIVEITARAFYALHDTRTPVFVGALAMGLNVVLSILFSALFWRLGWMPHGGLALANSLASTLEGIALLVLMRRRLGGLEGQRMLSGLAIAAAGSLAMTALLVFWLQAAAGRADWIVAIVGIGIGGAVYGVVLWLLKVPEVRQVSSMLQARLGRG